MRFDNRIQPGIEEQFVARHDPAVKLDLLIAVNDAGDIDADIEVAEDVELHLASRDRDERQRRHHIGVARGLGRFLAEVQRIVGLDRLGVLADFFLPADQVIVRIAIVGSNDVAGD